MYRLPTTIWYSKTENSANNVANAAPIAEQNGIKTIFNIKLTIAPTRVL